MNSRWMIAAAALLLACSSVSSASDPSVAQPPGAAAETPAGHRTDVDIAEFAARHAEGVTVIDVRTASEYAGGHVPGAVLVTLDTLDPTQPPISGYAKDEPVYVVCQTGRRSAVAADRLAKAGYTVVNVEGGTSAWIAAGHPVVQ